MITAIKRCRGTITDNHAKIYVLSSNSGVFFCAYFHTN